MDADDPCMNISRLRLMSNGGLFTEPLDEQIDIQADVLEFKSPGFKYASEDLLDSGSICISAPFRCPDAELEDVCINPG